MIIRLIRKAARWIKGLFRKELAYTVDHPDLAGKTEIAFSTSKHTYYRFVKDVEMPAGRYKWVHAMLYEVDIRMDLKTLIAYIDELELAVSGKRGSIDLTNVVITLKKMRGRCNMAFDVATVERLASVVYFRDDEVLTTWDRQIGEDKIKEWNREGSLDFFMTRPIGELLKLNDISPAALAEYVKWQTETVAMLTLEQPNP